MKTTNTTLQKKNERDETKQKQKTHHINFYYNTPTDFILILTIIFQIKEEK